jgi:hypothetical protein
MPKFKVLSPIEHNETHYWPGPQIGPDGAPLPVPKESPSFGHGRAIPVDASGVVELDEATARPLVAGKALAPWPEEPRASASGEAPVEKPRPDGVPGSKVEKSKK